MRKCIKLLSVLLVLLFTLSVKAKTYTKEEYKELGISRGYVLCDYVFDMKNGFNPTLKDFLLASQSCPIDNVTLYDIMFTKDINGNVQESFTELLSNRKSTVFPTINIKYVYNKSLGTTADKVLDNTPTNIEYDLDKAPYNETEFKNLNIPRSYVIGAYVFKIDGTFNPTLKDILLANQSNPKGQVSIYEISFNKDINDKETKRYTDLLTGKELTSFPELNLRYVFWGDILPGNHKNEKKQDLMTSDEITYTLSSYTYNGQQPNIKTATAKSRLPITYKVYPNTSCSGNEVEEYKNAGSYSVLASTEGNSTYSKTSKCVSFTINKKAYNTTGFTITLDRNTYNIDELVNYEDGFTPNVTVLEGEQELVKDRDYRVSYSNNKQVGNGAVAITFIGNYSGSSIVYFKISDKTIIVEFDGLEYTYNGQPKTFNVKNKIPTDVEILYGDSACDPEEHNCTASEKPIFTEAGEHKIYYIATVEGYPTLTDEITLTINKAQDEITCEEKTGLVYNGEQQSINDPTSLTAINSVVYYDAANCSNVSNGNGSCEGPSLPGGAPTNAGNYVAVITSTGNNNYDVATWYVRHNIAPKQGSLTTVTLEDNIFTYDNGNEIRPAVTVHDTDRNVDLIPNDDYVVSYENNTAVSTSTNKAKAIVTYRGNYTGAQAAEFTITNATTGEWSITSVSATYDNSPHTITVTVPEGFTVQYSENDKTNYQSQKPSYTNVGVYTIWVKITREGYEPIEQPATVTITQALDEVSIDPDSRVYNGRKFEADETTITTTSQTNVYIEYFNASDCSGSNENFACSNPLTSAPINVGNYYVKVTSNRNGEDPNYASGYCYASHNITPKSGGAETVTRSLENEYYDYDGNEKTPKVTITDTERNSSLVKDVDYTVAYTHNVNASNNGSTEDKPTVTVTFIGNYSGTWTHTFTIRAIKINEMAVTVGDENGTKVRVYVNKDIPNVVVKFGDSISDINTVATRHEPDASNQNHANDAYYESDYKTTCGTNYVYYEITSTTNYLTSRPTSDNIYDPTDANVNCQSFGNPEVSLRYVTGGWVPDLTPKDSTNGPITDRTVNVRFYNKTEGTSTIDCTQVPADNELITMEQLEASPITTSIGAICYKMEAVGYVSIHGPIQKTQ